MTKQFPDKSQIPIQKIIFLLFQFDFK